MAVKYALLALLGERERTGYELKVRFERALGECWQLNSGQVYSTLERLRRAGLIARGNGNGAPDHTRYSILPRGRREVERWLRSPVSRLRPVRDPLYVKLVFASAEGLPTLLAVLATEAQRYREAVEALDALVAREPMSLGGRARWLVAEASRLSYAAHLTWVERARRVLSATPPADRSPPTEHRAAPLPPAPSRRACTRHRLA